MLRCAFNVWHGRSLGGPAAVIALAVLGGAGCAARSEVRPPSETATPHVRAPQVRTIAADQLAVARVLDALHAAAARADEPAYFAHFHEDATVIATDGRRRVPSLRANPQPLFAASQGWSRDAKRREIRLSSSRTVAWFDEELETDTVGRRRASGVLVLSDGAWKIMLYHFAIAVPTERLSEVREVLERAPLLPYKAREELAYERAAARAKSEDYVLAAQELIAIAVEADAQPVVPLGATWLWRSIAWLRWANRDLPGAYAALDRADSAAERAMMSGNMGAHRRASMLRDRAVILLEIASAAPTALRAQSLAEAERVHEEHRQDGGTMGHDLEVKALDAFFVVQRRAGGAPAARSAAEQASRLIEAPDLDPIDVYLLTHALEVGGQQSKAATHRTMLRDARQGEGAFEVIRLAVVGRMAREEAAKGRHP